jgi:hypothetical protein
MNLVDYLKQRGGFHVFYRILGRGPQEWLLPQINVEGAGKKEMLAKQIVNVVHGKGKNKKFYVRRTEKIDFLRYFKGRLSKVKLVDIAVVSLSTRRSQADEEFNKALKQSKQWKSKLASYLNNILMPFLKELQASPNILAIIQRGDLTQLDRYPNPFSDIDILIITKFCQDNIEKKLKLLNFLKNSPGNARVHYYVFPSKVLLELSFGQMICQHRCSGMPE